jgi:predicted ATP-grasp superfamily ATP-dependent carboligase
MKIALTSASSYKAISIARHIKKAYPEIQVTGVSGKALLGASKYFDQVFKLPSIGTSEAYLEALAGLVARDGVNLLFPVRSDEVAFLHRNRGRFGPALEYLGPYDGFEQLNNKDLSAPLAQSLGIRTPLRFHSLEEALLPFVLKPCRGAGSMGVTYVMTEACREKMRRPHREAAEFVMEEFIEGDGGGCGCVCRAGEVLDFHCHRRLAEYPTSGGSSVYRETFFSAEMVAATRLLAKATNWSGFLMTEFKLTRSGEVCFIEANPRIWGSINHGLANGVDYFRHFLGAGIGSTQTGMPVVRTYLSPLCYASFFRYALRGEMHPFWDFLQNWRRNRADISILDDPGGWMSTVSGRILRWIN